MGVADRSLEGYLAADTSRAAPGILPRNDDPKRGDVDGSLQVDETGHLLVADASAFPSTIMASLRWLVMGHRLLAGHGSRRAIGSAGLFGLGSEEP